MPRFPLFLLLSLWLFPCTAQVTGGWEGGGVYPRGQAITSMLRSVGGNKKIALQITPKGEITGTMEASYDKTKAAVSFRGEVVDQTFLLGGRYDSARNLLLLVITHLKTPGGTGDRRFEKPDSLYYNTTLDQQEGRVELLGSVHTTLNRYSNNEWIGSSASAMTRLLEEGAATMHILPLSIRLERFLPMKETPVPPPVQHEPPANTSRQAPVRKTDSAVTAAPERKEDMQTPQPKRETEIQQTILLDTSLIQLDMYDNGTVDGDIATLLLDGAAIISNQLLSTKAVSVTLHLSKDPPEHLLELYANNMGSIPPNTALLVLTCNRKRYEIHLSSNGTANGSVKLVFAKK